MDINLSGVLEEDEKVMASVEGTSSRYSSSYALRVPIHIIATDKRMYVITKLNDSLDAKSYDYDEFEKISICSQIFMPKKLFRIIQLDKKDKDYIRIAYVKNPEKFYEYVNGILKDKLAI